MKNWIALSFLTTFALVSTFGCSMCCGPYDYDYPTYDSLYPRADQRYGRVGSVFSDPNANTFGPSADSNLEAAPELRSEMESKGETDLDDGGDLDLDAELERLKQESDSLREEISPMEDTGDGVESLPTPDGPTASRFWKTRPLRSTKSTWR